SGHHRLGDAVLRSVVQAAPEGLAALSEERPCAIPELLRARTTRRPARTHPAVPRLAPNGLMQAGSYTRGRSFRHACECDEIARLRVQPGCRNAIVGASVAEPGDSARRTDPRGSLL